MKFGFQRHGVSKEAVPLAGQETKSLFGGHGFAAVHRAQGAVSLKVDVLTNEPSRAIAIGKHAATGMVTGIAVVVVPVPKRRKKRLTAEVGCARIRALKHSQ